jgi:hypothetical protein
MNEEKISSDWFKPINAFFIALTAILTLALAWKGEWSLSALMTLFWLESGVIGVMYILRLYNFPSESPLSNIGFALFFCLHYGGFWAVHGLFVWLLFFRDAGDFKASGLAWTLIGIVLTHAWQQWNAHKQDLKQKPMPDLLAVAIEKKKTNTEIDDKSKARIAASIGGSADVMFEPYYRVFILQFVIVGGGAALNQMEPSLYSLYLLIGLKTAYEIGSMYGWIKFSRA